MFVAAALIIASGVRADAALGPSLQARSLQAGDHVNVVILLEEPDAVMPARTIGRPSTYARTRSLIASANINRTEQFLAEARAAGIKLIDTRTYWLAPFISARVAAADLSRIDKLAGVSSLVENVSLLSIQPIRSTGAAAAGDATSSSLDVIGARKMWNRGYTGKGTLAASIDTGVDSKHPALTDRYRGNHTEPGAAWLSPDGGSEPDDLVGHGTHTMGTVVGRDVFDTVGVAPDAEWISAGVVDRGRSFALTIADLIGAFEWLADPDGNPDTRSDLPDVVLNSWGIPQGILPPCDNTFWQVVDNLEALGTVVIFAAGNEGPAQGTLRLPSDRGDQALKCFTVGAVNALSPELGAAGFSSRGPVSCNSAIIKPELVAPGIQIRSCSVGGGYKTFSGTSMAAPFVAGAVLLLRQYNPDATPEEIKAALVASAYDLGPAGPDFSTGYGMLNVSGAMDLLAPPRPVMMEWDIPVILPTNTAGTELVFTSTDIKLINRGRGFEGVQIDLTPISPDEISLTPDRFVLDYIMSDFHEISLPISIAPRNLLEPGDRVWLNVRIRSDFPRLDTTILIGIQAGNLPSSSALSQHSGDVAVVASNYGRFDAELAESFSVTTPEFSYKGQTIDFTGGIRILAHDQDVVAFGSNQPFEPAPASTLAPGFSRVLSSTTFRDTRQVNPVGIEFRQRVMTGTRGPGSYVVYDYNWSRMFEDTSSLQLGGWFHWNGVASQQLQNFDLEDGLFIEVDGAYVGAVWLQGPVFKNVAGFTSALQALSVPVSADEIRPSGHSSVLSLTGEVTRKASGRFGLAIIAADTPEEWLRAAGRARVQYAALAGLETLPTTFELLQNYPNPFNPSTQIRYRLERGSEITLEIFNVLGRRVRSLVSGWQPAGAYEVTWDARNEQGTDLASGVYFVRIVSEDRAQTGKMTLLR